MKMENKTRRKLLRDLAGLHGRFMTRGLGGAAVAGLAEAGLIAEAPSPERREVLASNSAGPIRLIPPRHSVKRRA